MRVVLQTSFEPTHTGTGLFWYYSKDTCSQLKIGLGVGIRGMGMGRGRDRGRGRGRGRERYGIGKGKFNIVLNNMFRFIRSWLF